MKNLLYIGNNLKRSTTNLSSIQVLGKALEKEGFAVRFASSKINKVFRLFDMVWSCLLSFKNVDYVLIDTYSTQNFYYALIISQLCRLLKLPYLPILHGGNLESRLKNNPKLCGLIFNNSKINVAPSPFMIKVFESYSYSNLVPIPNALDIDDYPFNERPKDKVRLLWVRSFSNIYNPTLAIKILKELQNDGIAAELCMIGPDTGDGSLNEVRQLAEDLSVTVKFTGKLTKAEWTNLATNYNVFINTTNFDNMPVSVIEAMALGLPIVSTNVGGMPYLIHDKVDGFLVPPNDSNAFVNAIKWLCNNPESRNAMTVKARQKVEQFDWKVLKYQWFEVLGKE